jgi:hypothetical protein
LAIVNSFVTVRTKLGEGHFSSGELFVCQYSGLGSKQASGIARLLFRSNFHFGFILIMHCRPMHRSFVETVDGAWSAWRGWTTSTTEHA